MEQEQAIPTSRENIKMLRAMVGISALCGFLIVLTYEGTLPRVERLRAEALEKAIFQVIPGTSKTKVFAYDGSTFIKADDNAADIVYAGYDESGNLMGVAIEASGQGYADIIKILYGYDPEKQHIIGFYVLETKETPGLGDKIEKDKDFLANFSALDVSLSDDMGKVINQVVTVKQGTKQNPWEIDGITGATISSRAIGNIIGESTMTWVPRINKNLEKMKRNE
ncbi:MAG: FMN-binding protein [Cyclobacteriaceae bacterium]